MKIDQITYIQCALQIIHPTMSGDVPIEHDNIRSCTVPVSNINNVKPNRNMIVLKNE